MTDETVTRETPSDVHVLGVPFVYGGLLLSWEEGGVALDRIELPVHHAELAVACEAGSGQHDAATPVHVCVTDASRPTDRDGSLAMRWRWAGTRGIAESRFARVEIEAISRREVRAVASTAPGPEGRAAVLSLLATAVTERLGGLVLHATAVVVGGRAVLFVGPSGAGKTTAANHTSGAAWLCRDRALVVPDDAGGWSAWAIAGGDDVRLPRAPHVCAPVGGILRVLRGNGASRIVPLSRPTALLRLRESIQSGGTETRDEDRALESALRLLDDVTFAGIEVALGTDLGQIVASGAAAR